MEHRERGQRERSLDRGLAHPRRMRQALLMIGWSRHTGRPRFGPKAQLARWGLGADELPETERHHLSPKTT